MNIGINIVSIYMIFILIVNVDTLRSSQITVEWLKVNNVQFLRLNNHRFMAYFPMNRGDLADS